MTQETFDQRVERTVRDREIPGVVLVAGDSEGKCDSWNVKQSQLRNH
jgi:hypothetical protein